MNLCSIGNTSGIGLSVIQTSGSGRLNERERERVAVRGRDEEGAGMADFGMEWPGGVSRSFDLRLLKYLVVSSGTDPRMFWCAMIG